MLIGHEKQWNFLHDKLQLGQLSHAYLFTGREGIGKKDFALKFAEFVGCKFPDLLVVDEGDAAEINIKQVRKIQEFLTYKSYNGGFRVVIVDRAEKMNQEAQSCFLKTLEEPKGSTLIILISSKPDLLLSTISSRCQNLKFLKPKNFLKNSDKIEKDKENLKNFLLAANSDLADKFKYVKNLDFEKEKPADILRAVQEYLRYLLFLAAGTKKTKEQEELFSSFLVAKKYTVSEIGSKINLVEELNSKLLFTNANPKLAMEILLMEF